MIKWTSLVSLRWALRVTRRHQLHFTHPVCAVRLECKHHGCCLSESGAARDVSLTNRQAALASDPEDFEEFVLSSWKKVRVVRNPKTNTPAARHIFTCTVTPQNTQHM